MRLRERSVPHALQVELRVGVGPIRREAAARCRFHCSRLTILTFIIDIDKAAMSMTRDYLFSWPHKDNRELP
jgi:hypothetical protein